MRWRNIISRRTNCWCFFFWHATTADAIRRRDIAQYEGVSKGLVARSVESLVEKQFLVVERDAADKRICHLYLTQQCSALTEQMTEKKAAFSAGWPKAFRRKRLRRRNRHCAGLWKIYPHLLTSRKCFAIVRKESWNGKGAGNMRSADRRKAFFAVCMMAVLLFSHLGVCLWQTPDRPGAESDGRGRRGSTGYFTDDGLRLCLKRALSGTGSRIVTEYDCRDEKNDRGGGAASFFSSFYCCFIQNSRDSLCRGGSAYRHGGVYLPGRLPHGAFCAQFRR